MKKILVAYGSVAGSTKEVAETVAETLNASDFEAVTAPVEEIKDLAEFDGVVLGSSVRAFHLLPKTTRFLRKFKKQIAKMPYAIFLVCLVMTEDTEERRKTAMRFAKPMIKIKEPFSIGLFGGVMDPSKLTGYAQGMFKNSPYADNRDWDKIKTWAAELTKQLLEKRG